MGWCCPGVNQIAYLCDRVFQKCLGKGRRSDLFGRLLWLKMIKTPAGTAGTSQRSFYIDFSFVLALVVAGFTILLLLVFVFSSLNVFALSMMSFNVIVLYFSCGTLSFKPCNVLQ